MLPINQVPIVILALLLLSTLNSQAADDAYHWSGPYKKGNLTLFFAHGDNQLEDVQILTLDEALEQKKVKVHETGNVNQLSIENLSANEDIFIQSGDIVKGGKQDRVLSKDMMLSPKSGKVNISSFCVESGRWQKRGNEDNRAFKSSKKRIVSKDLKLATKLKKDQGEVWKKVSETQDKLSRNLGSSVKNHASQSSLQLSLENKKLNSKINDYQQHFRAISDRKKDVVGYAYAINGEFISADIYGSYPLFKRMWPRLLDATITESLSEPQQNHSTGSLTVANLTQWIRQTDKSAFTNENTNKNTSITIYENDKQARFDTKDSRLGNKIVHRNYLSK